MPIDPLLFRKIHKAESGQPDTPMAPAEKKVESPKPITPTVAPASPQPVDSIPIPQPSTGSILATTAQAEAVKESRKELVPIQSQTNDILGDLKLPTRDPKDFKGLLDRLDEVITSQLGISKLTIDSIRGYVKQIMMDLQTQPDLDALLIDRDTHNVLKFIRYVKDDAVIARGQIQDKKTAKAKKKFNPLEGFVLGNLTNAGAPPNGGILQGLDLEKLAKLKT